MLRIHDMLVWIRIRIRGSVPLTNGSGSGSFYFHQCRQKTNLKKNSAYYFLKGLLHNFQRKKVKKESRFFLLFLLNDRRIRIQSRIHYSDYWIRIRIQEAQKHVDPVDPDPQHWKAQEWMFDKWEGAVPYLSNPPLIWQHYNGGNTKEKSKTLRGRSSTYIRS